MRSALLALLLVGCTNPDEIIPASGILVSVDPVEGLPVRMLRSYQANYQPGPIDGATLFKETQADAEGRFAFEAFRIETQTFTGSGNYSFRFETTFPSGTAAWSETSLGIETRLSPFRDWRPGARLEGDVLRFEPAIAVVPPSSIDHRAQLTTSDGGVVWRAGDRRFPEQYGPPENAPIVIDALRLEDFTGAVNLEATTLEFEGSVYGIRITAMAPVELRAGERLALSGSRVPLSRGLPCAGFASPCPLTDGDLTMVDAGFREEVTLELPDAAVLTAVVLRGAEVASRSFTLELGQADGGVVLSTEERFDPLIYPGAIALIVLADGGYAQTSVQYRVVEFDAGVPVQRVTLRFPNGLLGIAEVSLFE